MIKLICAPLVAIVVLSASAQKQTMTYDESIGSPTATLSDIAWVQGHWRGEAFGGITEEIWTPPLGNSMMGVFKLLINQQVKFYEIITISAENNTLILRLKHFHHDLKGWEEKDVTQDFRLVKVSENKIYFDGFTFERISKTEINIFVMIEGQNGTPEETKFNYKRVTPN